MTDDALVAVPRRSRTFTLQLEYSATGEGVLVQLMVVRAVDVLEAVERFRQHFYPVQDASWTFFSRGLDVEEGLHLPWLEPVLAPRLLASLASAPGPVRMLALAWHFNAS